MLIHYRPFPLFLFMRLSLLTVLFLFLGDTLVCVFWFRLYTPLAGCIYHLILLKALLNPTKLPLFLTLNQLRFTTGISSSQKVWHRFCDSGVELLIQHVCLVHDEEPSARVCHHARLHDITAGQARGHGQNLTESCQRAKWWVKVLFALIIFLYRNFHKGKNINSLKSLHFWSLFLIELLRKPGL